MQQINIKTLAVFILLILLTSTFAYTQESETIVPSRNSPEGAIYLFFVKALAGDVNGIKDTLGQAYDDYITLLMDNGFLDEADNEQKIRAIGLSFRSMDIVDYAVQSDGTVDLSAIIIYQTDADSSQYGLEVGFIIERIEGRYYIISIE